MDKRLEGCVRDPASDEELEREQERKEAEDEAERLEKLDALETDDEKANRPLDTATWGETANQHMNVILTILQNVGVGTDVAKDLLLDAAMHRDPSLVDQKALVSKIGPRRAKSIMQQITEFSADARHRDKAVLGEVFMAVNGPNEFRRLFEQGLQKLGEEEMLGYVSAIDKGGPTARRAVEELTRRVAGGTGALERSALVAAHRNQRPKAQDRNKIGIDKTTYLREMKALHAPSSRLSFEKIEQRTAELRELRRIGRSKGL